MKRCWNFLIGLLFRSVRAAYVPYVEDYQGLGNRIKGLANFHAIGYRRFLLMWRVKGWVSDSFSHLFRLEGARVVELNRGALYLLVKSAARRFCPSGVIDETHPFWSFRLPDSFRDERFSHRWSFAPGEKVYSVDWRYSDIPKEVIDRFSPFFSALKPSAAVQARIDSLPPAKGVVGVHVRNSGRPDDTIGVCPLEKIMEAMDGYPGTQRFFLSAMNRDVASRFRLRYGGRVEELPGKDYSSMVDSVADMWLLGHCSALICSPRSTFSEVAWWWGGCAAPVTMLAASYNQGDCPANTY